MGGGGRGGSLLRGRVGVMDGVGGVIQERRGVRLKTQLLFMVESLESSK